MAGAGARAVGGTSKGRQQEQDHEQEQWQEQEQSKSKARKPKCYSEGIPPSHKHHFVRGFCGATPLLFSIGGKGIMS